MIKVCIFDLDGTLTATLESIARPINRMLEHFGLQPHPVEKYKYYAGTGWKLLCAGLWQKPEIRMKPM